MKKLYFLLIVMLVGMSSCAVVKVPPGQAKKQATPAKAAPGQVKKTTGSQSAAPYAPGQQKKAATPAKKKS
jgi:hypothetical protein